MSDGFPPATPAAAAPPAGAVSSPPPPPSRFLRFRRLFRAPERRRLLRWSGGAVVLAGLVWYGLPWLVPWPEALDRAVPAGVRLTDRHGTPLRRLLAEDGQRADGALPLASLPPALIGATLAAEDQRFFHHGGVDFAALFRALRDGALAGRRVSGASTITQQLVKLAVPRPRTFRTKILEILTARRVEMTWSKDRILEQYLARLDYGNLHRGPAAAAAGYFGKPLRDCSLAECALLAGLPQAPSRLNPWRDPARAVARQLWILGRLEDLGRLPADEVRRAMAEPLTFRRHYGAFDAPHFTDLILERVQPPAEGGWRTSLDLPLQHLCESAVNDRLSRLSGRNVTQAAVVVMDNATGEIRALVGSRDYHSPNGGQVNGATARRSPGSALKPFTWLLALSGSLSPATILPDLPVEYITPSGLYRPRNYHHRAAGPVSLRAALANSLNLSAVRLLESHGGPEALVASLQSAGLSTLTRPPADYGLGLTIGGGEVTLLELTSAYSTLARMGLMIPFRMTPADTAPDPGGSGHSSSGALQAATPAGSASLPAGQQLWDPDACWLLADILSDNDARARSFGTQSSLRLPFRCAVKTGTSTDYRDNLTIGYNAAFTVGVWVGNFDNSPMRGVSGVSGAAPIFRDIMSWLETRHPSPWFPQPSSIVGREVDPLTGLPVPPALAARRPVIQEKFRRDLAPSGPDPSRYDAAGRVLLPPEYAPWLAGPDNWLGGTAVAGTTSADAADAWKITSPLPGTTLLLDPDLPGSGQSLTLRTTPARSDLIWTSSTLQIEGRTARLVPGRHTLTARDPGTGREATTWIQVRRL